jgi:hypothetical protein
MLLKGSAVEAAVSAATASIQQAARLPLQQARGYKFPA